MKDICLTSIVVLEKFEDELLSAIDEADLDRLLKLNENKMKELDSEIDWIEARLDPASKANAKKKAKAKRSERA